MEQFFLLGALVAYLGIVAAPRFGDALPLLRTRYWMLGGIGLHLAGLAGPVISLGHLPVNSMHWGLVVASLLVVGSGLVLRKRPRMLLLGNVVVIWSALLLGLSMAAPDGTPHQAASTSWFVIHVGFSLIGIAAFVCTFSISALYLLVRWRLKKKHLQGIASYPTLATLDRLNYQSMGLGFLAITTAILLGVFSVLTSSRPFDGPDLTIYATLVIWLWYAAGLHLRLVLGWRGRLVAVFGLVGFGGVLVLIAIAMLFLHGWH